ncbi:MAG TPA: CaiB/BaiF CoA-transferase family protein [Actinomycetota bacterium]|nr:CaiB/BaiF CoA-transferase family protein [Actinomycetota bacterium]
MSGPLDGVRVLDLTRLLPGGFATLLLADLGADVVKVEEPQKGDYIRWTPPLVGDVAAPHIALNRNKRSLTLNLKEPRGRDLLLALAGSFDVLVESFRPGVLDRLGVGRAELAEKNPRLVYCAITGYGQDGPRAAAAGHDADYIGYGGVLGINGPEDGPPVLPGVQIGDLGGGMSAVIAILAALLRRERTGGGAVCDISMLDTVVSWLSIHAAEFVATRNPPLREQMHLSGRYPCYRVYPAADGYLAVGALEPQFWSALCRALERPDFEGDAFATGERRAEVIGELEALFQTKTRSMWMETLAEVDACVAPVNDFAETFADEQVRARGMVVETELPGVGRWSHVGNPIRVDDPPASLVRRPPPELGEHTAEVLAEVGLGDSEVDELRRAGVV